MLTVREMTRGDRDAVLAMMRTFYDSPAVLHHADDAILARDFDDCTGDCPYAAGYVFDTGTALAGYAMLAISYSTEYGGVCIWVEDLYLLPQYRHRGIGSAFFAQLERDYAGTAVRFRLEVEAENETAIAAYRKNGYAPLPYIQMTKEPQTGLQQNKEEAST